MILVVSIAPPSYIMYPGGAVNVGGPCGRVLFINTPELVGVNCSVLTIYGKVALYSVIILLLKSPPIYVQSDPAMLHSVFAVKNSAGKLGVVGVNDAPVVYTTLSSGAFDAAAMTPKFAR
jgi:hypothetical protein